MTEMAILFDSSRCTGCRGCQVACKCWNDLPSEPTAENPYDSVNWDGKFTHPADLNSCTRLIMTFEDFEDEKSQKRVGWAFGRRACQHCTNAGCVNMCPAGALYKDEETGMVLRPGQVHWLPELFGSLPVRCSSLRGPWWQDRYQQMLGLCRSYCPGHDAGMCYHLPAWRPAVRHARGNDRTCK